MKVSILIDGGYLNKILKKNSVHIDEKAIHAVVMASIEKTEILHKVLYYDCRPYKFNENENAGTQIEEATFERNNQLLNTLARQDQYVLRLGKLKFLGRDNIGHPILVQKGVDIRIALDMARIVMVGKVERLIIITGDTDLVPAMEMARTYDIQIVTISMDNLANELYSHSDFIRTIDINKLIQKRKLKKFAKQKQATPSKPSVPRTSINPSHRKQSTKRKQN